jgi:uroporphyrinogen-III synthase
MRLIVTRPREDARRLSQRLAAAGHEVILAPLLDIWPRDDQPVPERPYQAVLITSANGARALMHRPELARLIRATAIAVGPASAAAARDAGFVRVAQAEGDVAALACSATGVLRPEDGPLLYVSGAVTAGDLASSLGASGFEVDRVVAYEARPVEALPEQCASALAAVAAGVAGAAEGVILYSPRTARIWASLVAAADLVPAAMQLSHYCLSDNVAASVRYGLGAAVRVQVASRPDEAALLEIIPKPA